MSWSWAHLCVNFFTAPAAIALLSKNVESCALGMLGA
jgi:hypothetical protein